MHQVERVCASVLSVEQFQRHYAHTRTPLVITGLLDHMTSTPWTLDHMEQVGLLACLCAAMQRNLTCSSLPPTPLPPHSPPPLPPPHTEAW